MKVLPGPPMGPGGAVVPGPIGAPAPAEPVPPEVAPEPVAIEPVEPDGPAEPILPVQPTTQTAPASDQAPAAKQTAARRMIRPRFDAAATMRTYLQALTVVRLRPLRGEWCARRSAPMHQLTASKVHVGAFTPCHPPRDLRSRP